MTIHTNSTFGVDFWIQYLLLKILRKYFGKVHLHCYLYSKNQTNTVLWLFSLIYYPDFYRYTNQNFILQRNGRTVDHHCLDIDSQVYNSWKVFIVNDETFAVKSSKILGYCSVLMHDKTRLSYQGYKKK